ncbi:MAG TPA: glutathione S-transferase N-terminal domain-containing protein [Acidimicrobiales bacterium]|nr:glutathione S-transferase N-terminal domain-containing protein [Acidimicrobiales bacterium]
MIQHPLLLGGTYGSPYSLKMRAVLRYRRIPFRWVLRNSRWDQLPDVAVKIIPVIAFPDENGEHHEAMVDSTPQIERLEAMVAERSLVPVDPVVAFLDELVEDYADEWLTKAMYHHRWAFPESVTKAGQLLPLDSDLQMPPERWEQARRFITDRQISRRALVGSTDANAPIIEGSYERLLDLLQEHLVELPFLFGHRPGRSDMGLFGQLSQLVRWDPSSVRIAEERAPRVVSWVTRADDLSWLPVEGDEGWRDRDALPASLAPLLAEMGRTYAPFMIANAAAHAAGAAEVVCEIDGHEYRQGTFSYQVKCLGWLREHHAALADDDRRAVDAVLAGTGCEQLFA